MFDKYTYNIDEKRLLHGISDHAKVIRRQDPICDGMKSPVIDCDGWKASDSKDGWASRLPGLAWFNISMT